MPPSNTKTPDPPPIIPPGCAGDNAKASCYVKGYQDGWGRGYQRAFDDFHTSSMEKRKGNRDPKKTPVECGGTLTQCYKEGFNAGYDLGYVVGAQHWEDA